jgi:hypothetical protein
MLHSSNLQAAECRGLTEIWQTDRAGGRGLGRVDKVDEVQT